MRGELKALGHVRTVAVHVTSQYVKQIGRVRFESADSVLRLVSDVVVSVYVLIGRRADRFVPNAVRDWLT